MVETVIFCKKLYFLHEKFKIQEKEGSTNFVLLCQLRNMVGQFKKSYFHRPVKILQFLTPNRIQKCLI